MKLYIAVILVVIGFGVSIVFSSPKAQALTGQGSGYCDPTVTVMGRRSCFGYFSDAQANYTIKGSVANVISGGLNDTTSAQFIADINAYLNRPVPASGYVDSNQIGAAFIVDVMMKVSGPNAGGPVGAGRAVANAKARYAAWVATVQAYDAAGHSNYNTTYDLTDGTVNSALFTKFYGPGGTTYSGLDDAFHLQRGDVGSVPIIQFFDPATGSLVRIEKSCGNFIGTLTGLSPAGWTLSGISQAKNISTGVIGGPGLAISALPGDTITFIHTIKNLGPGSSSAYNTIEVFAAAGPLIGTACSPAVPPSVPPPNISCVPSNGRQVGDPALAANGTAAFAPTSFVIPATATPGQQYCQLIGFAPQSSGSGVTNYSSRACVTVAAPPATCAGGTVAVTGSGTYIQPGDTPTLVFTVPSSTGADRKVPYVIKASGGGTVTTGNATIPAGSKTSTPIVLPSSTFTTADVYTVSWTVTATSGPCPDGSVSIVDLPFFQAYGQSVLAGGEFQSVGACTGGGELAGWFDNTSSANGYGASSQLSALALLKVVGFASAQTVASRSPTGLSFANTVNITAPDTNSPGLGGVYDNTPSNYQHCLTEPTPNDTATTITSPYSVTVNNSWQGTYTLNDGHDLTINASQLVAGQNVSIFVDGSSGADVYIKGNITYNQAGWNLKNIPSFVLVTTGNIYIDPSVTELDGLFIARNVGSDPSKNAGQIFTCATGLVQPVGSANVYNLCNNQLTVYGSFTADQINLMRTYGTLKDGNGGSCTNNGMTAPTIIHTSCAAEVFEFSPEMYLSDPAVQQPANGGLQYDNITSLPPVL